jgi:alpha-N-arabinofuranosidase
MILTEGAKMVLTPTYHVFEMYKAHQDATALPLFLEGDRIEESGVSIPQISASASRDAEGKTHLSLCNLHVEKEARVEIELRGAAVLPKAAKGRVLSSKSMDGRNGFDAPREVEPREFAARIELGKVVADLPPMSVVVLEVS